MDQTKLPNKSQIGFLFRISFAVVFLIVFSCKSLFAADVWQSGRFSFSDELGGFEIENVTGSGTMRDPFVIRQILNTSDAATLVIRAREQGNVTRLRSNNATYSSIHVQIVTTNNSNLTWIGLGFELQEKINIASDYGDGLSFDQLGRRASDIYSNRFADFEDQFEPGDRLIYTNGYVNNQTSVITRFIITDFTPVKTFYLYQDPLIPAS